MERINAMRAARSRAIILPGLFDERRFQREAGLIQALLAHKPDDRPSASELASMLPPVVSKEYINDSLKLLDSDQIYKKAVLKKLFSASGGIAEYTFDAVDLQQTSNVEERSAKAELVEMLISIFRKHGAIERDVPVLIPVNRAYDESTRVVKLLDQFGNVLQLPFDAQVPLARSLARGVMLSPRTYVIRRMFSASDRAPAGRLEASFDICPIGHPRDLAELIHVAQEVLLKFPRLTSTHHSVRIGHADLLVAIFDAIKVPQESRQQVCNVLRLLFIDKGRPSTATWKKNLASVLSEGQAQELLLFAPPNIEESLKATMDRFVSNLTRHTYVSAKVKTALEEINDLAIACTHYKISLPLVFNPLLADLERYVMCFSVEFELSTGQKETLCTGGRFDRLVERNSLPSKTTVLGAVGMSLAVEKLEKLDQTTANEAHRQFDVIISSHSHEEQAMDLLHKLWDADIKAALDDNPEHVSRDHQKSNALFLVTFKDKRTAQPQVKIKNLTIKDRTIDLCLELVSSYLAIEIARQQAVQTTGPPAFNRQNSQSPALEYAFITNDERKGKRQILTAKAAQKMQSYLANVQDNPFPIMICDFEHEALLWAQAAVVGHRSALDHYSKTQMGSLLEQIDAYRSRGLQNARLYSFRAADIVLLTI